MLPRPMSGRAFRAYELRRVARLIAEHAASGPVKDRALADVHELQKSALAGAPSPTLPSVTLELDHA